MKLAGKRPSNLGVSNGRLAACPNKPNCVNSQATDKGHAIEPLKVNSDAAAAMQRLTKVLESMPRTQIIERRTDYLYAECSTPLLGFVDDVEFYYDGKIIHARSASRLGYSDWGVNRKRIETIRAAFTGS
ncbi:MAG: DUF1499 domain-containing protein [Nevskiales bacterium]